MNLHDFTSDDPKQPCIHVPFRDDEYIYATDGRIAIRIPYDENGDFYNTIQKDEELAKGMHAMFANFIEKPDCPMQPIGRGDGWKNLSLKQPHKITCIDCNGSREMECGECNHKEPCTTCHASGQQTITPFTAFWSCKYQDKHLIAMARLPNCTLWPDISNKINSFTFTGGEGVISKFYE